MNRVYDKQMGRAYVNLATLGFSSVTRLHLLQQHQPLPQLHLQFLNMLSFKSKTFPQNLIGNRPWTLGGLVTYYSYAQNVDKLKLDFPCEGDYCNPGFRRVFDQEGRPYMAAYCFQHTARFPAQDYAFLAHLWAWKHQADGLVNPVPGPYNRQWFGDYTITENDLVPCHLCCLSFRKDLDVRRHIREDHFESGR